MTVTIVTDLGYGDAGKGTVTDWLSRRGPTLVVRHNGGPNAGHNVITPTGEHHCFSQFGSGTLAGASTFLSRFMLINPLNAFLEARHLMFELAQRDLWQRTHVDENAVIVTPWHVALNRLQAGARGASCGEGIGVTMKQNIDRPDLTLRVGDLLKPGLTDRLNELRRHLFGQALAEEPDAAGYPLVDGELAADLTQRYRAWAMLVNITDSAALDGLMGAHEHTVFEGSQAVLLDQGYGFHPFTTWSTCTHANAERLLKETSVGTTYTRLGVTRAYMVRHGAGPFPTEDPDLCFAEPHNTTGEWQGGFRQGHLDIAALRYAITVCGGVDALAVTHCDRAERWRYSDSYTLNSRAPAPANLKYQETLTRHLSMIRDTGGEPVDTAGLLQTVNDRLGPVGLVSYGPSADDKKVTANV
jgi:adenylosuccinate synthase